MQFRIGGIMLEESSGIPNHKFILTMDGSIKEPESVIFSYYAAYGDNLGYHNEIKRFFELKVGHDLKAIGGGKVKLMYNHYCDAWTTLALYDRSFKYGSYDHRIIRPLHDALLAAYRLFVPQVTELTMYDSERDRWLDDLLWRY